MLPELPLRALVVIDLQQGFNDPRWGRRNNPDAENNVANLLAAWRGHNLPVIHVVHNSTSSVGAFHPKTPGNLIKAEARPLPGEPIYRKTVNSVFIGTSLEKDLHHEGITSLVLVGLTTNHCVSTSARMASNLGFEVTVVEDATAAFEMRGMNGRTRAPEDVHETALSDLNGEFALITDTASLLARMRGERSQRKGVGT